MFKVEFSEKQLKFLELALDNMLRSQGLAALQGVVDMTNVLRTAKRVKEDPQPPEPKQPVEPDPRRLSEWDNM
jgi:hypothetical protein